MGHRCHWMCVSREVLRNHITSQPEDHGCGFWFSAGLGCFGTSLLGAQRGKELLAMVFIGFTFVLLPSPEVFQLPGMNALWLDYIKSVA